ncbi:MAG: tyrosine-type recombinase/integrase, partial [Rhizobiaceae bacterium]|nr:tyrosine-type recombinase/integrase [Rhizobiaceae bacterium]
MATFRKRLDKWQVQIRRKGFAPISRSFRTKADAQEWARHWEQKADRGELPANTKELEITKLSKLVERYQVEVLPTKKGAEIERIILDAFLRDPLCRKSLSTLTPSDFAKYRDRRLQIISAKSLGRQLSPVSHMLNLARVEWGLPIRSDLLSNLRLGGNDNKRERRLREGELERLVQAAKKTRNPLILPIVQFAVETGMRRGEILAMDWKHVDLERRSVVIPEAKNGYSRTI